MKIAEFFQLCNAHPWAYIALLINFGVVFVNGWTDGPNSIATAVTTRAIKPRAAVIMCALANAVGVIVIGILSVYLSKIMGGDVSQTIANLVNWGEASIDKVLCGIACGLLSIIIVSLVCTFFGFPSSQSNCLIGGITGSGLALMILGNNGSIGANPWIKVLIGFFGSLVLGFLLGYGITLLIQFLFRKATRGKSSRFFDAGQVITSGLMSFFHGVQDGAKFIGISILIGATLSVSNGGDHAAAITSLTGTWWIYLPVALFISLGTMMGGYNIIKTMGSKMVKLQKYQAFSTDIAASIALLLATFFALPVSTGTVKSTAIMGGGATKGFRRVKWPVAGRMVMWGVIVFPASAIVAMLLVLMLVWTCK
jgi:PiT family inorganic phosphate transporter